MPQWSCEKIEGSNLCKRRPTEEEIPNNGRPTLASILSFSSL
jgi:hypothetical protein